MPKTAITNVRVFDGHQLRGPETVIIEGDVISTSAQGPAKIIDGSGCTLLPGLIDCHVHVSSPEQLNQFAMFGTTTVLDMGALADPNEMRRSNTSKGAAQYRGSGVPAFAPGSSHEHVFSRFGGVHDVSAVPDEAGAAAVYVDARVAEGCEHIKIIADAPGHSQETLNELARKAREHGRMSVAHALHYAAYERCLDAGFDIVTHVPMDRAVDDALARRMATQAMLLVPTLTMMESVCEKGEGENPGLRFPRALAGVATMHGAGVPILAGTDTNSLPGMALGGPVGSAIHRELELYVRAGLSPVEALRTATSLPAGHFGLRDRGCVDVGMRADLLLVEGDPTQDVGATRNIRKVWVGGIEV